MSYKKPEVVAESDRKSSYVAGCPEKNVGDGKNFERTR